MTQGESAQELAVAVAECGPLLRRLTAADV